MIWKHQLSYRGYRQGQWFICSFSRTFQGNFSFHGLYKLKFFSRHNFPVAVPKTNSIAHGCVAQSVTCLATDVSLTADLGVKSLIPAQSHDFVEIDHEIISMVILLPSTESFKKSCCQLQVKVCAQITG